MTNAWGGVSRRTFLAASVLSACGTAPFESLKLIAPVTNQPVPRISDTLGVRWFLALTGQSNAVGWPPALTTMQPFENQLASIKDLPPLVEIERESIKSAAANMLTHLSEGLGLRSIAYNNAVSNAEYARMKRDSAAYSRLMRQLKQTLSAVEKEGDRLRVLALLAIHGESDHVLGNRHYAEDLREWQQNFEEDARAATKQVEAVPMFTDQVSNFTVWGDATSAIPLAQLAASVENPNTIFCVGPKYQYPYSEKHLGPAGQQWHGEQYGKVMKRVFLDGESWRPVSPLQVMIAERRNVVRASFHVPNPPLVFDTSRVPEKTHMGFELTHEDRAMVMPLISRVALISEDTVELETSGELSRGTRLRYAATGQPNAAPGTTGPNTEGSARGNLRDSDATRSFAASWDLFNWCAIFDSPILGLEV